MLREITETELYESHFYLIDLHRNGCMPGPSPCANVQPASIVLHQEEEMLQKGRASEESGEIHIKSICSNGNRMKQVPGSTHK